MPHNDPIGEDGLYLELLEAMRTGERYTPKRTVPAEVLRRALLTALPASTESADQSYHRLTLTKARIDGDLDLRGTVIPTKLSLYSCVIDGVIRLLEARLPGLQLDNCDVAWIDAANSHNEFELWVKDSRLRAGLDLADGRIDGSLHLDGSEFGPDERPVLDDATTPGCALRLNRMRVGGSMLANRIICAGMMDLSNATIGGDIELDNAHLHVPPKEPWLADKPIAPATAIHGPNLTVGGSITADVGRVRTWRSIVDVTSAEQPIWDRRPRTESDPFEVLGRIYLPGATVGADVDLTGAQLRLNPAGRGRGSADSSGPNKDAEADANAVLVLDRAKIEGNVELDHGFRAVGLVRLTNAEIGGDLRLHRALLNGRQDAPDCACDTDLPLAGDDEGFRVYSLLGDGAVVRGQVDGTKMQACGEFRLRDARIAHNLFLDDARIHAPGTNALHLERTTIGGMIKCWRLRAQGSLRMIAMTAGPIYLDGAHLSDPCTDRFTSPTETAGRNLDPVLNLTGAHIAGVVLGDPEVEDGVPLTVSGSIFLRDAQVARAVRFRGARIDGTGIAIDAAGLSAATLDLTGLVASGTVRFADARISGDVDLRSAVITGESVSIDGASAQVGGSVRLDEAKAQGLVTLRRATVARLVNMSLVRLSESAREVLDLAGLHTPDLRIMPSAPVTGSVDLSRVVTITLIDNENLWVKAEGKGLDLWGFEYQMLMDGATDDREASRKVQRADLRRRIEHLKQIKILPPSSAVTRLWLRPPNYVLQPYLQLAAMYRAMGQDRAALEVLYQMRVQEANVAGSRWMWPLNLFYRLTVGYGYKLHRAIALLLLLWAVGFGCLSAYAKAQSPDHAWHWAYGPGVCAPASPVLTDVVATQQDYCGSFVPVLYSLDAILPVVDLGQESAWYFQDPLWQFGMDLLQIGGWVLAAAAATFALNLVVRGDGGAGRPTEARWSRSG